MDLVKTLLVYMVMLVSAATDASPDVTPIPPNMIVTPTPYVTMAPTPAPTASASATPSPSPTPKPTSYATLFVGQKGTNVRKLQERLRELGYLTDKVDGAYGKNTKKAVEEFQRNNGIKVDGVAGKETQTILFESTAVIPAGETPTPAPTATSTPAAAVNVPIYYLDTATNQLLYRTERLCYGRSTVYADASRVPSGYTLAGDASVVVTVSAGKASPATVLFRYDPPAQDYVTVKVYYRTYGGVILNTADELFTRGERRTVWANDALIPYGYQLSSENGVAVSVSGTGYASPSSVTFYLSAANTPTPTAIPKVSVPIYYQTVSGTRLATTNETLERGRSTNVYCDARYIPDGYILASDSPVRVYVNNSGRATPLSVTFYLDRAQTPTPAPTATPRGEVQVSVYYVNEYNDLLYQTAVRCLVNDTTDVAVDLSKVPSYQLLSEAVVPVYVDWYGNASPQMVTFTFRERTTPTPTVRPTDTPAPTATPQGETEVNVYYVNESNDLLYQTMARCLVNDTTDVAADLSKVPSYQLLSEAVVPVYVDWYGNASPQMVTFTFRERTTPTPTVQPTDTPAPIQYVPVDVQYLDEQDAPIYQTSQPCRVLDTTDIAVDFTFVPQDYELVGDAVIPVYVDEYGNASPNPAVFRFALRTPPVIVTDPPVPPALLTARGALLVNGQDAGSWYDGAAGGMMVDLNWALDAAGIARTPLDDGYTAIIGASELVARYTSDAVIEATVDGRAGQEALMSGGTLYVSIDLLSYAGMTYELDGETLNIQL